MKKLFLRIFIVLVVLFILFWVGLLPSFLVPFVPVEAFAAVIEVGILLTKGFGALANILGISGGVSKALLLGGVALVYTQSSASGQDLGTPDEIDGPRSSAPEEDEEAQELAYRHDIRLQPAGPDSDEDDIVPYDESS